MLKVMPIEYNADDTLTCIELNIKEDVWSEIMPVKSVCEVGVVEDFK